MQKTPKTQRVKIGRKTFKPIVLRVVEEDELGRPLVVRVMRENETAQLSEDENANKFHVALVEVNGGLG